MAADATGQPVTRSRAFGLELDLHGFTCAALPAVDGRTGAPAIAVRTQTIRVPTARRVLREDLGAPYWSMRIDDCGEDGYLISEPQHGRMLVEADGSSIACEPPPGRGDWDWQWFLIAHGLPLASLLCGRELLHASAVIAPSGEAIIICGASGWGKSTLALALARAGCVPLADDVVALEAKGDAVLVHPGGAVFNCDPAQTELSAWARAAAVADLGVFYEKAMWVLDRPSQAAAFGAIVLLAPYAASHDARLLRIEPTAATLMGQVYGSYLQNTERLLGGLRMLSMVAADVPTYELQTSEAASPARLAEVVLDTLGRSTSA